MSLQKYYLLDLEEYFNADGISYDSNPQDGLFSLSACYPAEELPESNSVVDIDNIPIKFPSKEDGDKNNIECYNQILPVQPGLYKRLFVLGSCDNGNFEEKIELIYDRKVEVQKLYLSDWITEKPFTEKLAFRCEHAHSRDGDICFYRANMWMQTVEVDCTCQLHKLNLPDNPCFHVFAITLERGEN